MSYTREQRAANAAKKAAEAARAAESAPQTEQVETEAEASPREQFDIGKRDLSKTPRGRMMAEIEARNQPQVEAAPETVEQTAETPKEEKPKEEAKPAEMPAVEMVKIKVDGEEFSVPKDEVEAAGGVRAYQIEKAQENRLKKTAETLAEVKRIAAEMAQRNAPKQPEQAVVSNDEFIKSKLDDIRFGSPEQAAAALQEVLTRSNPKIDENLIVTKSTVNWRHDSALAKFKTDFPDVSTNPVLSELVPVLSRRALQQHMTNGQPDWGKLAVVDWNDFYSNIGNQIRGAAPKPSQPQPTTAATGSPSPSDREAKKAASVTTIPTAAARAAMPEETKPESREDILEGMRKARKLPTG